MILALLLAPAFYPDVLSILHNRCQCRSEPGSKPAWYDSSPNNARNPDPTIPVGWGDQSWEEMMIGWLDIAVPVIVETGQRGSPPPIAIRWRSNLR